MEVGIVFTCDKHLQNFTKEGRFGQLQIVLSWRPL